MTTTPSEAEYDAAKHRQLVTNPEGFTAAESTDEVLADVATINAYEAMLQAEYDAGQPDG